MSLSATTKLSRGAAWYTALTRELVSPARVLGRDDRERREVRRIEQNERVRQIVGDRDHLAVVRDREVARVDPGADLGDQLEPPEIVLADPAVARREVDEPAVRRELRPAVQGEAAGKTRDRREPVAIRIVTWWSPVSTTTNRLSGSASWRGASASAVGSTRTSRDAAISVSPHSGTSGSGV